MPPRILRPQILGGHVRKDPKRRAEVRLYDALHRDLSPSWSVWYSRAWLGPVSPKGPPKDGEADFVIAHPDKGILVLEVKGGEIRCDTERGWWQSRDRGGVWHDIQDPVSQAERSRGFLLTKLKSLPSLKDTWVNIFRAVAFPDFPYPPRGLAPDTPAEIVVDRDDLGRLASRLEELFAYWLGGKGVRWEHGSRVIRELESVLGGSNSIPSPLKLQRTEEDREIVRLTEEQFYLLDFLSGQRRAAIGGCAGSGKTFLAVEKAKRLAQEGYRTLLTCFNRGLSRWLQELTEGVPGLTVHNFHTFAHELANQAGIPLDESDYESYPDALTEAVRMRRDLRYDAVVADEGQDFQDIWWVALEECLASGKHSIFYVFYDTHQTLYRGRGSLPHDLEDSPFPLTKNLRNTQAIFRAVNCHWRGPLSKAVGPHGRPVQAFAYEGETGLNRELAKRLTRLLGPEGCRNSDVVVLTPRALHKSALPRMDLPPPWHLVTGDADLTSHGVRLSTVYSFKGLEVPVAVVAELDDRLLSEGRDLDALCYVAFSRPRNHLVVLGSQSALLALLPEQR